MIADSFIGLDIDWEYPKGEFIGMTRKWKKKKTWAYLENR
jgi:GH18 family chitinase